MQIATKAMIVCRNHKEETIGVVNIERSANRTKDPIQIRSQAYLVPQFIHVIESCRTVAKLTQRK